MKEISLTRGYVAQVDDTDFGWLSLWKWRALVVPHTVYAYRTERIGNGRQRSIYMHRQIMDLPADVQVDHIDNNGLNNQRSNLRPCNNSQNHQNSKLRTDGTSRFKGVSWCNTKNRWRATIKADGKHRGLGYFRDEVAAALAYDAAAARFFGEFAQLNFPQGSEGVA